MASRKKAPRREILAVRIDKTLKRKLAAIAAKAKRSVTGQIAFMIEALIEQHNVLQFPKVSIPEVVGNLAEQQEGGCHGSK